MTSSRPDSIQPNLRGRLDTRPYIDMFSDRLIISTGTMGLSR